MLRYTVIFDDLFHHDATEKTFLFLAELLGVDDLLDVLVR